MKLRSAAFLLLGLAAGLAAFYEPPSPRNEFIGAGVAVDGDTLDLGVVRIRLYGIDAPEHEQKCTYPGGITWTCGTAATIQLAGLIAARTLKCSKQDKDRYERIVAICFAGETDIGAEMVRLGMAIAYTHYSDRYALDQQIARVTKRGIWSGTFQRPEDWRRDRRSATR